MGKHRWKAGGGVLKGIAAGVLLAILAGAAQGASGSVAGAPGWVDAPYVDRWSQHIREASARFGIPEEWIRRVGQAESGGRTMLQGRPIASRAGAMGLMQLVPGTSAEMRARHGLGPDPHDPRDNILAGAAYLRAMYDRFGYPRLFAAYNAGPARYARHLQTGEARPSETIAYMAEVAPDAGRPASSGLGGRAGAESGPPAADVSELFASGARLRPGPGRALRRRNLCSPSIPDDRRHETRCP